MIALAAALLMQASQPNPFTELIPRHQGPIPPGWGYIGGSTTGALWYVHMATATRNGNRSRVWVKIDYSQDRTVSERRAQGMVTFYCAERLYHWESLGRYDASDRLIDGLGVTRDENVAPDSMIEAVWRVACQAAH